MILITETSLSIKFFFEISKGFHCENLGKLAIQNEFFIQNDSEFQPKIHIFGILEKLIKNCPLGQAEFLGTSKNSKGTMSWTIKNLKTAAPRGFLAPTLVRPLAKN